MYAFKGNKKLIKIMPTTPFKFMCIFKGNTMNLTIVIMTTPLNFVCAFTYSRVWIGKHLSDMFPIKKGLQQDALLPLLFNFPLEYAIRRVQVKQDGLKLNDTHQLLVYADDVNLLGGNIHTIKENTEALVAASKKTGLEVNADKTK